MTGVRSARRIVTEQIESRLLLVTSNPCGRDATPLRLGRRLAEGLVASHPGRALVVRDLDRPPQVFAAAAAAERSPDTAAARAAALAQSGACLDELFDADVVVLAAGVTSRSLSTSLKAWFERVMLPELTFAYRHGRVEGLLHGKKVYVVFGVSRDDPGPASQADDFHEEYLRLMLKIMGLTQVEVIRTDDGSGDGSGAWDKVAAIVEDSL